MADFANVGTNLSLIEFTRIRSHYNNLLIKPSLQKTHNAAYLLAECVAAQCLIRKSQHFDSEVLAIGEVLT